MARPDRPRCDAGDVGVVVSAVESPQPGASVGSPGSVWPDWRVVAASEARQSVRAPSSLVFLGNLGNPASEDGPH